MPVPSLTIGARTALKSFCRAIAAMARGAARQLRFPTCQRMAARSGLPRLCSTKTQPSGSSWEIATHCKLTCAGTRRIWRAWSGKICCIQQSSTTFMQSTMRAERCHRRSLMLSGLNGEDRCGASSKERFSSRPGHSAHQSSIAVMGQPSLGGEKRRQSPSGVPSTGRPDGPRTGKIGTLKA